MEPLETVAPSPQLGGRLLRGVVGISAGVFTLVVAHRGSQALSRYALAHRWLEPYGGWWSTRFIAWAAISIVVGALIGFAFGRRAIGSALLAAVTPPILYICTFLYLYEDDALANVQPYWFETCVILLVLPAVAYLVGNRHGA